MPKLIPPLTDIQLRNAKPTEKPYKLSDGGGMYVEIMRNGSKFWRMKVRQSNGKESRLTFGSYPEVTLAGARAERSKVKQQQATGLDPAQSKRIEKLQKRIAAVNTFEVLAREWHTNKAETWKENTAKEALARLENDVFPRIGKLPIADVDAPFVLDVLHQIERRGAVDMAACVAAHCSSVFRFAIAKGIVKYNPIPDLRGALGIMIRVGRNIPASALRNAFKKSGSSSVPIAA
jgi:ribosomal protein L29